MCNIVKNILKKNHIGYINMRIKIKEDAEAKNEGKDSKKEDTRTDADDLPNPLLSMVLEYLGDINHLDADKNHPGDDKHHPDAEKNPIEAYQGQNHPNSYKYQSHLTFLGNVAASYATQIAHNLLWHFDVDKTLELAKLNPASLLIQVEIKDPHGQRVRGTPLQIVAAAGDRNPRKMKRKEKDYGLVERLRPCFLKMPDEYNKQLKEWFERDLNKEETKKTMAPYVMAIEKLCQEIIDSKEITHDTPFETLLKLPIVEKFRKALTPDPNHVVTSGFLFALEIFLDFFTIWEFNLQDKKLYYDENRPNLGFSEYRKSRLFAAIVYPALQARVQRIDFEILAAGISSVAKDKDSIIPTPIDFTNGIPERFNGLGDKFFFGYNGYREGSPSGLGIFLESVPPAATYGLGWPDFFRETQKHFFSKIISSKNISNAFMPSQQNHKPTQQNHKSSRCTIM